MATTVEWEGAIPALPEGFLDDCRIRAVDQSGKSATISGSSEDGTLDLNCPWQAGESDVEIHSNEEAAVLVARIVTRTPPRSALPPIEARFATTRGTNALLERRGTAPVLFTTRGFGDLLAIGNQQRPDLFALHVSKPEPLYARVIEVDERLRADGSVKAPLDLGRLDAAARSALDSGERVAAVVLLHSYRNPTHELRLAAFLEEIGFDHVSVSSELSSRIKVVPRAETTVVDAYLAVVVGEYLERVADGLGASVLHVMTSAGGLVRDRTYRAKDSLLSGPAGGVVGAVAAARASGVERLLAFDMGGTSTDVTRHDGELEYRSETVVGGVRLASPSLAVETVAAGGGSICRFDGMHLKVGPASAGSLPGPACYGKSGPLTLTDVNLLLGRLHEPHFPFNVRRDAAQARAKEISDLHSKTSSEEIIPERLLFGFLEIANEKMAGAVRAISLRAGYQPSDYTLLTFGGAGPQHACALADLLAVGRVVVPSDAALLSASGLGHAHLERIAERQVLEDLAECEPNLDGWFDDLQQRATVLLEQEGVSGSAVRVNRREIFLRFVGQEATLAVGWTPGLDLAAEFGATYESHFGYRPRGRDLEVESLRLIAYSAADGASALAAGSVAASAFAEIGQQPIYTARGWAPAPVVERNSLDLGRRISGPALVVEDHTVTVVEPDWNARVDVAGALVLERK